MAPSTIAGVLGLRILAVVVGTVMVGASIVSAVKTVVMPRASSSAITRSVFLAMRQVFNLVARGASDPERRDRLLAGYAPTALIATLATWLLLVLVGFTLIFWGLEDAGWLHAFDVSGSSLFTLGFTTSVESWTSILVFLEAGIGLFLLALMISYLPSLYAVYARREVGIAALEVRAGSPPSAREMILRYRRLERLEEIHEVWVDWQRWFAEVEESHSSYPALVFFRGSHLDHSWVTSAGAVLDAASLTVSSVEIPRDVEAEFCIRAGYLCLREIAGYFDIAYDPDPRPDAPISITREEFLAMLARFEEVGVPLKPDREQAWLDFAGWRVNYDAPLLALARLTDAPPAEWSSDRSDGPRIRPPVLRRRKRSR
jgi:hypothetical protein